MRISAILLTLCGFAYSEGITTRTLNPLMPLTIDISQEETTTLQFPDRVTELNGLGLVKPGASTKSDKVETQRSKDGTVITLRALSAEQSRMTVKMGGRWYVITLNVGKHPDMVTTLQTGELQSPDQKSEEVDDKTVIQARPNYDPINMERLMDLSRTSALTKASIPSEYEGYNFKTCSYKSDDRAISSEVTKVHTWDNQDSVVVEATVTNNSGSILKLDSQKMSVAINKEQHPITFMRKASPIPPHQSEYVTAMVVGDYGGSRGRFNIRNDFYLIVNGDAQNYATTDPTPVATPEVTPTPEPIPLKKGRRP
jgi:hypothetical protein